MTQNNASLKRLVVTPAQAEAINEYGNTRTEFAIEMLRINGLSESQATQAIAVGYRIANYGEESE